MKPTKTIAAGVAGLLSLTLLSACDMTKDADEKDNRTPVVEVEDDNRDDDLDDRNDDGDDDDDDASISDKLNDDDNDDNDDLDDDQDD